MVTFRNNNNSNNRRSISEETTEISNQVVKDKNLDQIFQIMKVLKESHLEEIIIMPLS